MIRIAVVDDDWYISSRIERILLSYDHISTYDLDIEVFQNGLDYFKDRLSSQVQHNQRKKF